MSAGLMLRSGMVRMCLGVPLEGIRTIWRGGGVAIEINCSKCGVGRL